MSNEGGQFTIDRDTWYKFKFFSQSCPPLRILQPWLDPQMVSLTVEHATCPCVIAPIVKTFVVGLNGKTISFTPTPIFSHVFNSMIVENHCKSMTKFA